MIIICYYPSTRPVCGCMHYTFPRILDVVYHETDTAYAWPSQPELSRFCSVSHRTCYPCEVLRPSPLL